MTSRADFYSLRDRLSGVVDQAGLLKELNRFTHRNGFRWVTYLCITGAKCFGLSTYPRNWQDYYLKNEMTLIDPVVQAARRSGTVFSWCTAAQPTPTDERSQAFMDDAVRMGIASGVTVPVDAAYGRKVLLTFSTSEKAPPDSLDTLDFPALSFTAFLDSLLYQINVSVHRGRNCPLSPAHKEVLNWLIRGKSIQDISDIKGVTRRAIEFQLQTIRRTMGVASTYEAVATAIQYGWIRL